MTILVLGATGHLGRLLLPELRKAGVDPAEITGAGRNQEVLAELADDGYRTATVKMSDAGQVARAVTGHDRVVLISGMDPTRLQQHRSVVEAAKAAQVKHFSYTSGIRADDPAFLLGADHKATEDAIRDAGLTHTILRNGWYIENYIPAMKVAAQTGILTAAVGDATVAAAGRRDYAEALASVVTTDGHDNRTYTLTGERDFTYDEIAAAMADVLGTPVKYRSPTADEYRDLLVGSGMDAATTGFLIGLDGNIADGILAHAGDDLTRLIGHPTMTLAEGLRQEA